MNIKNYIPLLVILAIISPINTSNLRASLEKKQPHVDPTWPEYICALAEPFATKPIIFNFLKVNFINLKDDYPADFPEIYEDFSAIAKVFDQNKQVQEWKYPLSWHTTVLYIGLDKKKLEEPIFKEFVPGTRESLESMTMVYVPNKIICAPVFRNIKTANHIPHVTLVQGEWSAKYCNDVLEAVFYGHAPLATKYKDLTDENYQIVDKLINMRINEDIVDVYVIKYAKSVIGKYDHFKLPATDEYQYTDSPTLEEIFSKEQQQQLNEIKQ